MNKAILKIALFMFILMVLLSFVYIITNPSLQEFEAWYEYNVNAKLREQYSQDMYGRIDIGNKLGNTIVRGLYDLLLKDAVMGSYEDVLKGIKNSIEIERNIFYTVCKIHLPEGKTMIVIGVLGNFHIWNID